MKGTKPTKHWLLSLLALFLAGAPLAARAAQPTSAAEADQRTQHYQGLVKGYQFQGGALYKTGVIQRAQMDANNCAAVADAMRSGYVAVVATPSEETPQSDDGARIAVLVPNETAAPATPKCPAP
jgi:hypothetical protein